MSIGASENFLFTELKAGNTRAFDKVFKEAYPNLCRYSNTIVHDEDKAQSLVQNVFVRLWENHTRLGNVDNLQSYLVTMVRNESLNYLKREKRVVHLPRIPDVTKVDNTFEEHVHEAELLEKLVAAINELPERCRMAFEFSRFENLNYREISQRMGISVKAVEALMTRALKQLRQELARYLPSSKDSSFLAGIFLNIVRFLKKSIF